MRVSDVMRRVGKRVGYGTGMLEIFFLGMQKFIYLIRNKMKYPEINLFSWICQDDLNMLHIFIPKICENITVLAVYLQIV